MKRLIITEDEKNRILGMHKSVFYEQVVPPTSGITTPANTTMGVMGDVRQQQRQQRQDLRQQQGAERKDLRHSRSYSHGLNAVVLFVLQGLTCKRQ